METHIAKRKTHRCDLCGRRIPIGARYFCDENGDNREHTNCLDFTDEPLLNFWYNKDRKVGEVTITEPENIDNNGRLIERD